ncbi:MAG: CDP-diacylglycerol--glycerol-3-phosphate 3-phosphatidyltransferase [Deltaproteobacteria bacterium RBG_13_61_14]|nr:MAG: CDP-diacylglycerol--glycerol-3-phosphate 3-phosphatidyltransferase [Deltaproteobacteria bacterium RBG_13_61_14]
MTKTGVTHSLWNLPNLLTLARVAAVPILIVLLLLVRAPAAEHNWFHPQAAPIETDWDRLWSFLAGFLFLAASFTDYLDGLLARRMGLVTSLGKFLDPLADKLLITAAMIMLVQLDRLPGWMVVLIICREIAVTGLRAIAAEEGIVIAASGLGKQKTLFQVISLFFVLVYYPVPFPLALFGCHSLNVYAVGLIFFYGAFFYALWSGFDYFRAFWSQVISK